MISYMHFPILILCGFSLFAMWRFWACINRLGYLQEVGRRDPSMLTRDLAAAICVLMPFVIAAMDWFTILLPRSSTPISPSVAVFFSMSCLVAFVFILKDSGERFVGHWTGTRKSALHTLAKLGIINADELEYGLQAIQAYETNRHLNTGDCEVRK